jgi:hypothetical protein
MAVADAGSETLRIELRPEPRAQRRQMGVMLETMKPPG